MLGVSLSNLVSKLELKQKESLFTIKTLEKNIINLKNMYRKEMLKNNILTFLLEKNTNISVSKLFDETESNKKILLNIHDDIDLSFLVQNKNQLFEIDVNGNLTEKIDEKDEKEKEEVSSESNESEKEIKTEKEDKDESKKITFRCIKKAENEKTVEETEEKIKKIDETFNTIKSEHTDVSYKETVNMIENIFSTISKARVHKKDLDSLKLTRFKLLGKLNIDAYISLLNDNISKLKATFVSKKYDEKRITELIQRSLNGLESRLIYFDSYYNTEITPDEQFKLKSVLKIHMDYSKRYIPFNIEDICKKFYNYGIVIFTLKENMLRILNNPYKFFNIIYIKPEKTNTEDPYSFYYLEKINSDGKRFWKMDCRLEEISKNISFALKTYCVNLFRKIYFDIFQDNLYRRDYTEKAIIAREDLEQLLQNILKLVRKKEFCLGLQDMIISNCTISPTILDKFNLMSDDKVSKKNFSTETDKKEDSEDVLRHLFDKLSKDDLDFLIATKCDF